MKTEKIIYTGAIVNGVINAIINGLISWFSLKGLESIPFTLDNISNHELTIFGNIFPILLSLSIILGIITYYTFKKTALKDNLAPAEVINKPLYPTILKFIFGKTFSAFGLMLIVAVFWQKFLGTIYTTPFIGTLIIAIAAGLVVFYIAVAVSKELLKPLK